MSGMALREIMQGVVQKTSGVSGTNSATQDSSWKSERG